MNLSITAGFIWGEIKQMWDGGLQDYIHDWWNLMDFVMNSLYLATISLKIVAFVKVTIIYVIGKAKVMLTIDNIPLLLFLLIMLPRALSVREIHHLMTFLRDRNKIHR